MAVDGDRQCADPALGARQVWMIATLVVAIIATMGVIPVDQVVTVRGIASRRPRRS